MATDSASSSGTKSKNDEDGDAIDSQQQSTGRLLHEVDRCFGDDQAGENSGVGKRGCHSSSLLEIGTVANTAVEHDQQQKHGPSYLVVREGSKRKFKEQETSRSTTALLEVPKTDFWSNVEDQVRYIDASTCDSLDKDDVSCPKIRSTTNVRGSLPGCCSVDVVDGNNGRPRTTPSPLAARDGPGSGNKGWSNRRGRSWHCPKDEKRQWHQSVPSPAGYAAAASIIARRKSQLAEAKKQGTRSKSHARSLSDCRRPTDLILADIAKTAHVVDLHRNAVERRAALLRYKSASVDKLLVDDRRQVVIKNCLDRQNYQRRPTASEDFDDRPDGGASYEARLGYQWVERQRGNSWAAEQLRWLTNQNGVSAGVGSGLHIAVNGPSGENRRDLRYYFQHPYPRLFVAYLVIFCNFLLFAEDPISHSHTESNIPVVGNVFSFVLTKYPPEWTWSLGKVLMWILAIGCGLIFGKMCIHRYVCGKVLRLQMFRDEQGSWMIMWLSVIVSLYLFSHLYNFVLLLGCPEYFRYKIDAWMGVSNSSIMKAAACGTWLGDLFTAWFVTDMMLQDNLYSSWAPRLRRFWRTHDVVRIVLFWFGSVSATTIVVTFIVFDVISWDSWNQGFVATTELSRAFLASFILVMDLIILMQDWDFPHFSNPLSVNLSGFRVASLNFRIFQIRITGKWFNYGVILVVMILDLNMWKNQFFYQPEDYGQYVDSENKIYTVIDESTLATGNKSSWTWQARNQVDLNTSRPYFENDIGMNSKFIGYSFGEKSTAFIPSIFAFSMFFLLVSLYGRFPATEKLFRFPTRLLSNRDLLKMGRCTDRYELTERRDDLRHGDNAKPTTAPLLETAHHEANNPTEV